jgi:hypothetical protein
MLVCLIVGLCMCSVLSADVLIPRYSNGVLTQLFIITSELAPWEACYPVFCRLQVFGEAPLATA